MPQPPGRHGGRRMSRLRWIAVLPAFGLIALRAVFPTATAAEPCECAPSYSLDRLVRMGRCELESLYRQATPAPPPCGFAPGRAIFSPGSKATVPMAGATRVLWQGKEFP